MRGAWLVLHATNPHHPPLRLLAVALGVAVAVTTLAAGRAHAQAAPSPDLRLRLSHLEEERASLDWTSPLALHLTGGVLAGGAALVGLGTAIFTPMSRRNLLGEPTGEHDDTVLHASIVATVITGVIGALLVLAGVVMRSDRERRRRAIDLEVELLRAGIP